MLFQDERLLKLFNTQFYFIQTEPLTLNERQEREKRKREEIDQSRKKREVKIITD